MSQSKSFGPTNSAVHAPWALVLDTNVVLDLLAFRDPTCRGLVGLLESGSRRWWATLAMRTEFDAVLRRPAFQRWQVQLEEVNARWARWAEIVPAPARSALRCADPDDQMFLDLALQRAPSVLLSRDRELLRLARPAAALGVRIAAPADLPCE